METKQKLKILISEQLNPQQRKAVLHTKGPLLVIAGAGSGKTRVITTRIINLLIQENVSHYALIALTFTNKAAQEMRERVTSFLERKQDIPFIGTFHSYCLWLLRSYSHLVDLPVFFILDADDQKQLLQSIIKRNFLEKRVRVSSLIYQISALKNSLALNPQTTWNDTFVYELYQAYESEKEKSKYIDFDDLLILIHKLFKTNNEFKKSMQEQVRHILIDEYQDTNIIQHALLEQMALNKKKFILDSLCAVGDEDQSIYSWRGATVENIRNFKKDFDKTTQIYIEQNYRSVQPILKTANHLIDNNTQRIPKKLWSEKKAKDRIRIIQCSSNYQEGEAIAALLHEVKKKKTLHDTALFYRAHYQSRSIEEALIRHGIPYTIIGGISFYERKEIKDILAYLRLIANPYDRISCARIINIPQRGLGKKFEEELFTRWNHEPLYTFCDVLRDTLNNIPPQKRISVKKFIELFYDKTGQDVPSKIIKQLLTKIQYFTYLEKTYDKEETNNKIDNIKELLRATTFFEKQGSTTIESFLYEVSLMQEKVHEQDDEQERVQLMTLHAAKGLEFDTVVVSGLEEGIFPSQRSIIERECLEEERRLFYVGITRAKEQLLLTHAKYRTTYGTMQEQTQSRFLEELPTSLVTVTDCSLWNSIELKHFFSKWLGTDIESTVLTFGASGIQQKPKLDTAKKITPSCLWKKHQPVKHSKFGVGIIKKIEEKGNDTYLHVKFSTEIKKVKANFIECV